MSNETKLREDDIANYWARASTRSGRLNLAIRRSTKYLAWRGILVSTLGLKRVIDILISGSALCALTPIYAMTALAVKLEDSGPIFFRQERVGYRGRRFHMHKFRSMVINADSLKDHLLDENRHGGGVTFKMKRDPRITRIGRFIRKFSIDELPQFWDVFRGDMSIVGPRPPVPREVALYSMEERQRLMAKPGLTCFWQVGGRADIDFDNQVRLDVQYIRSESVLLDLKLLFLTIPAVLLGKGAY